MSTYHRRFLRRFGLRTGDIIEGNLRVRTQNEKFSALLYMTKVNERPITYLAHRNKFEDLTPIFQMKESIWRQAIQAFR